MNIYHGDNKEMDAVDERIHLTNSSGDTTDARILQKGREQNAVDRFLFLFGLEIKRPSHGSRLGVNDKCCHSLQHTSSVTSARVISKKTESTSASERETRISAAIKYQCGRSTFSGYISRIETARKMG
jgi:hypothetical protein